MYTILIQTRKDHITYIEIGLSYPRSIPHLSNSHIFKAAPVGGGSPPPTAAPRKPWTAATPQTWS